MKELLSIESFGGIDADNDNILFDCFEDHDAYIGVMNKTKYLIVGRKGSGKTAIFKKIVTTKSHDFFSFGHTFSDYPWSHHDKQVKVGVPSPDKYTHSWTYLILLTISKIILNQDQSLPYDEPSVECMRKIERFVVDTYGTRDPDITQIFTPSKRLKLKPAFGVEFNGIRAGFSPENLPMEELPTIIQEVNANLIEYVLSSLNPKHNYYICFDQLDLGFNPQDPEYANRLIGLLLACREINQKAKDFEKNLFVSVFLRDDIYEGLHFEDKNKITQQYLSMIEWDTARTTKTLKELMEKRFNRLLADGDERVTWDDVFDENKQMPGHQTKYQHIIDRTYLRPRDIIKMCNEILKQYKKRIGSGNKDGSKFVNIDIVLAREAYSDYFLKELDDEIHKHIPRYSDYLEIFKSIGVLQFDKNDYLAAFSLRKERFPEINHPLEILNTLYRFSIIGFYRIGGRGYGGSEYIFRYNDPRSQFDENSQAFKLHPGLMEVLGLKRYSRG